MPAAGRKQVDYSDIGYRAVPAKIDNSTITFSAASPNGSASVGLAVTYSADDTVALTADGNQVAGKLIQVAPDGFCTIQTEGYMTLPGGNAAALTRGNKIVGALGAASARGYIRAVNTAVAAELGVAKGEIVANGDTTNVVVHIG